MPISVTCDECSEPHRVRDDAVGKQFVCKGCGKSLTVEAPAQINDRLDQQSSSPGVAWGSTGQGWRLIASKRSNFEAVAMFAICVIALVGLVSSIQLLRAAWNDLGGWFILAFCLPVSILSAYQMAFALCGKIVITVEGYQGTVFTGVGVVGRRQHFDWSRTTSVDDECVSSGSKGLGYELVLDGTTQIRFGRSLSEQRQLEVLAVLRQMLRQEQLSQRPGSLPTSSSKVVNDLDSGRRRRSDLKRLAAGAPKFAKDALICEDVGWNGKPVSVIVDRTEGMIHFQNCHSPQGFWAVSAPAWFICPLSELVAVRHLDRRGKRLMIVTKAGEASISSTATNYERLDKILPGLIPQHPPTISADHPVVMKMSMLWSLFTTLAGLMTGWFMTALNASNSSLFLHLLVGAIAGAALPFFTALLMSRKRDL